MAVDEYFSSHDFVVFQDESLRDEAVRAVDTILSGAAPVRRSQLYAITAVTRGAGLAGLRKLAERQKEKNTKKENEAFWSHLNDLLSAGSKSSPSLFLFLRSVLLQRGVIEDENRIEAKIEQRQTRKRNKVLIEAFMEHVIEVYFEHFTCHYFYMASQRSER